MNSVKAAITDIEYAFNQLEFSIRLMCYCELGHLDLAKFDSDITILLDKENVGFASGNYATKESAILASQMQVGSAFANSAIVLDAGFEAAGIKKNIKSRAPESDLQVLIYMVRCAFAHNIAAPTWDARGSDYARVFTLELDSEVKIDLSNLNGNIFEYEHIGGFAQWFKIKAAAIGVLNGT